MSNASDKAAKDILAYNFKIKNEKCSKFDNKCLDVITVLYTNADCLTNKRSELLLLLSASLDRKPDIIAITEVKPKFLKTKLNSSEFYLEGYNLFVNNNFEDSSCRGTLLYVIKQLTAYASLLPLPCDFQEHVFDEIRGKFNE